MSLTDREDLSWLAGLIDGEGSVYVSVMKLKKQQRKLRMEPIIRVGMKMGPWIARVQSILSRHSIVFAVAVYPRRVPVVIVGHASAIRLALLLEEFSSVKEVALRVLAHEWPRERSRSGWNRVDWPGVEERIRCIEKIRSSRSYTRGITRWTPEAIRDEFRRLEVVRSENVLRRRKQ